MLRSIALWSAPVLAAAAVAFLPAATDAGCLNGATFYPPTTYNNTVVQTATVAGVPYPVYLPAREFQFVYAPALPTATVVTPPVAAPQPCTPCAAAAAAKKDHAAADRSAVEKIVRETLENVIREKLQATDPGPPAAFEGPDAPAAVEYPNIRSGGPVLAPALSLQTRVEAALQGKCQRCHQAGDRVEGNVVLFDAAGRLAPNVSLDNIATAVRTGAMPPAAKGDPDSPRGLSREDRGLLEAWSSGAR